jgi:hypothetical protein
VSSLLQGELERNQQSSLDTNQASREFIAAETASHIVTGHPRVAMPCSGPAVSVCLMEVPTLFNRVINTQSQALVLFNSFKFKSARSSRSTEQAGPQSPSRPYTTTNCALKA